MPPRPPMQLPMQPPIPQQQQQRGPPPQQRPPAMDPIMCLSFLHRSGFAEAAEAFRREYKIPVDPGMGAPYKEALDQIESASGSVVLHNFRKVYGGLDRWSRTLSDDIKDDVRRVCFPIFVHLWWELMSNKGYADAKAFVNLYANDFAEEWTQDVATLHRITSQQDMRQYDSRILMAYRLGHKIPIRLSRLAQDVLMSYLLTSQNAKLLEALNYRCSLEVVHSGEGTYKDSVPVGGKLLKRQEWVKRREQMQASIQRDQSRFWGLKAEEHLYHPIELQKHDLSIKRPKPGSGAGPTRLDGEESVQLRRDTETLPLPSAESALGVRERDRFLGHVKHRRVMMSRPTPAANILCYDIHTPDDPQSLCVSPESGALVAMGMQYGVIKVFSMPALKQQQQRQQQQGDRAREGEGSASPGRPPQQQAADDADMNVSDDDNGEGANTEEALKASSWLPHRTYVGHSGGISAIRIAPDDRFIMSAAYDGTVRMWSTTQGTNVLKLEAHPRPFGVQAMELAPHAFYYVTGSADRTVRLFCTERREPLRILIGHEETVSSVAIHPNSSLAVSGSRDKTLRLWDLRSAKLTKIFYGHDAPLTALAASPNGKLIAAGTLSGRVYLWDLQAGKLCSFTPGGDGEAWGSNNVVRSLDFTHGSSMLASASSDHTVTLYDTTQAMKPIAAAAHSASRREDRDEELPSAPMHVLKSYPTQDTNPCWARFTPRNLLIVAGPVQPPDPAAGPTKRHKPAAG